MWKISSFKFISKFIILNFTDYKIGVHNNFGIYNK